MRREGRVTPRFGLAIATRQPHLNGMERNHTGAGLARNLPQRMGGWFRANPVAGAILILCLVIEGVLEGADAGLWGQVDWRMLAVDYGAFFSVLLHGAQPNYPLQPVAMFVTYGFLHAGFVHVAVNMFTLVVLAAPVSARLGQARFAMLYFIALIAGGAGFGWLSSLNAPMLGASGALFGLAGAILAWAWRDRRRDRVADASWRLPRRLGGGAVAGPAPAAALPGLRTPPRHCVGGAEPWLGPGGQRRAAGNPDRRAIAGKRTRSRLFEDTLVGGQQRRPRMRPGQGRFDPPAADRAHGPRALAIMQQDCDAIGEILGVVGPGV